MLLQFTKAVEAKQVAQQDAERARFVVMKADQVSKQSSCPVLMQNSVCIVFYGKLHFARLGDGCMSSSTTPLPNSDEGSAKQLGQAM